MSWNAFKYTLMAKMAVPTYSFLQMNSRIPSIPTSMDNLFASHFDVSSAGGRLLSVPLVSKAFSLYLKSSIALNRQLPDLLKSKVSDQIKSQALLYWTGRVINGPAATVITLFPGIWIPLNGITNLVPGAKQWIDLVSISLYIQKMTVIGISISKAIPGLVLPWYGAQFQGLDTPVGLPQLLQPMINSFNGYVDLLMNFSGGDLALGNQLKSLYENSLKSVLTQELYSAVGSIATPYGVDYNNLNALTKPAIDAFEKLSNP